MESMGAVINNIVLCIWKLPREESLKVLTKGGKICNYVRGQKFTRLIMVIISQYIQISIVMLYTWN